MNNLEKIQAYGCLDIYVRNYFSRERWYDWRTIRNKIFRSCSMDNSGDFGWKSSTQGYYYWSTFHSTVDKGDNHLTITHSNPITKRFNAIQKELT